MIPDRKRRAAIILAGGEGKRLAELTRRSDGVHVPKQFCSLVGEKSLLEETRRRVSRSVTPDLTSIVLNKSHECFYAPLLAEVAPQNLVVQPENRGTAPAILYALFRLAESAPGTAVLLVPSDQHVEDEAALMNDVDLAFAAVEEHSQLTVLLGIKPDAPETGYGWIEPAPTGGAGRWKTLPVRRFWEKPSRQDADGLMAKGSLWNSFIIVSQLPTLLGLFVLAMPKLYDSFEKIRPTLGTRFEEETVSRFYQDLRPSDFSRQVLELVAGCLSVLPVSEVGWSDLGEPHRVAKVLANPGAQENKRRPEKHPQTLGAMAIALALSLFR
ncbi:MAG: NTP transferase domain-containing protein [Deltaproteobacteria bacterium]|nr:NTP transferase domain-containing protein [Deltaproteobacteria bacterium]